MIGYKAFKEGLINKYGKQFELNKIYKINDEVVYGEKGKGYHFSKNLEDTMRFFNPCNDTIFCQVEAQGNMALSQNEEYYNAGDMYAAEQIIIKKY